MSLFDTSDGTYVVHLDTAPGANLAACSGQPFREPQYPEGAKIKLCPACALLTSKWSPPVEDTPI